MNTYSARPDAVAREWLVIDATDLPLGRLASEVAKILRGKHKPIFTRHIDTGDAVVIINAEKVRVTGSKEITKVYYHHTGYPGGIKGIPLGEIRKKHPTRLLEDAIRRMIPRTPLGRAMFRKLKVYAGANHDHAAQQPRPYIVNV